ncbi:flagellar basal body rod protein FlgB [Chitinimonas sp. DQS-5]|uniref:Flagellar basal body rod protein FlgB n=2 Tax=Parachitinimonas caeni TaxID=3031301 RepID=A0ABT7DXC7_9NEIS|nr:flagellar basal body rod protein FlgB [Parachitinimonas caeni]
MIGKIDQYLSFQENALKLRTKRQEVLASNIANADTPNFKARDFDFAKALDASRQKQQPAITPPGLSRTDGRHLSIPPVQPPQPELLYRNPHQPSIDGNTVEVDTEMAQFSDNAVRYQASLTFMQRRIEGLKLALQSQ